MPGQLIPRGKGVWLVRVYVGTVPDTGKRFSLAVLFSRPYCHFPLNRELTL
jgi:hypothetical protein